jgi:uncharacterized protein YdeI (YjbR/CyaY-like superfamily)
MIIGMKASLNPTFFPTQAHFHKWLEKNSDKATELLVGFYKVGSGKPSITWGQSVDEALCVGWIDGVRRSIDEERYSIRFTPRKPKSIWSAVNIRKVEQFKEQGLMKPAGLAAYELRHESRSKIYSHEQETVKLSEEYETLFKANKKAWSWFLTMPPSYHKPAINWVMTAKQEVTRLKRLNELITDSETGIKIKMLRY